MEGRGGLGKEGDRKGGKGGVGREGKRGSWGNSAFVVGEDRRP